MVLLILVSVGFAADEGVKPVVAAPAPAPAAEPAPAPAPAVAPADKLAAEKLSADALAAEQAAAAGSVALSAQSTAQTTATGDVKAAGGGGIGLVFVRKDVLTTVRADVTSAIAVEGDEPADYGSEVLLVSPDHSNFSVNAWYGWGPKVTRDGGKDDAEPGALGLRVAVAAAGVQFSDTRTGDAALADPAGNVGVVALDVMPFSYRLTLDKGAPATVEPAASGAGTEAERATAKAKQVKAASLAAVADPQTVFSLEIGATARMVLDDADGFAQHALKLTGDDFAQNAMLRGGLLATARFRREEFEPFVKVSWFPDEADGRTVPGLSGVNVTFGVTVKGDILTVSKGGKAPEEAAAQGGGGNDDTKAAPTGVNNIL